MLWLNVSLLGVIKENAKFDTNNTPMGNGINLMVVVSKDIITVWWQVRLFVFAANMYIYIGRIIRLNDFLLRLTEARSSNVR